MNEPKHRAPQIPEDLSKAELNELPLIQFEGTIHLITNEKDAEDAVKALSQKKLLGFDTESRPSFKKGQSFPISLIQFAYEHEAFLFRLNQMEFPQCLKDLLCDPKIVKVGVGLENDFQGLRRDWDLNLNKGYIDLGQIARNLKMKKSGLRSLTGILLKHRISKKAQVSNWENPVLTDAQVLYAATDAWISYTLYHEFLERHMILES